mmetsp:Transcript_16978/g.40500  ORF Transcript_16978/g.40500 Transcript_16978/m.40500 type:complete len:186 (+) Transcript_16978:342-899(+)
MVLVMGSGFGTIDSYLFLYLEELKASEALMGACLFATSVAEAPIMYFSNTILRLTGVEVAMHMVIAAFVLRTSLYTLLPLWPTPWLVLPVELLHGITFGLAWSAGTHKAAQLAPDGLMASMQGLFASMYIGVGRGAGGLVGGLVYDRFGARCTFQACATWIAVSWAIISCVKLCFHETKLRATQT